MANIGQQLLSPEAGWRRYNETDSNLIFSGSWASTNDSGCYQGNEKYTSTIGSSVRFKFYGTKLRIITYVLYNRANSVKINIDGEDYFFSVNNSQTKGQALVFEKIGLEIGIHNVIITAVEAANFGFDAIDIDDNGYLSHPILNEKFNIFDMNNIGDAIKCEYVAPSGSFGTFEKLGSSTKDYIPTTGSATPNGSFYWIYVGNDSLGRKKLIADRNIQISTSWDALNNASVTSGALIKPYIDTLLYSVVKNVAATPEVITFDTPIKTKVMKYVLTQAGDQVTASVKFYDETGTLIPDTKIKYVPYNYNALPLGPNGYFDNGNGIIEGWYAEFDKEYNISKVEVTGHSSWYIRGFNLYSSKNPFENQLNLSVRLLTGGISGTTVSTDKDNEWDKYIVESNLNGLITAGSNAIWNYEGINSWTSTTPSGTPANRVLRGGVTYGVAQYSTSASSVVASYQGFRPMLIVETLISAKYLIQDGTQYKIYNETTQTFDVVGDTLTEELFKTFGMLKLDDINWDSLPPNFKIYLLMI